MEIVAVPFDDHHLLHQVPRDHAAIQAAQGRVVEVSMTSEEIGRLLEAIRHVADGAIESYPNKTEVGGLVRAGMIALRDDLVLNLDVREFIELEAVHDPREDLVRAMLRFCERHCARSRGLAPGEHTDCEACPLASVTVQRLQRTVAAAIREDL
jgi:hypothetical protein